jgi:hypothetical protein
MDTIETVILGALEGEAKAKLRETAIFRVRKKLGDGISDEEN